ncbi:transcriptional repressor LexA [Streptomyces syringium]|uniref:LexA repressor n=1 Tax=Streptomyces syringium TaxID=76729 RepID=A0ABS4XW72_9ACTN|nr:transcriptional repressor LexA [Streptomyces syringium]MBP2400758.1 repressor LexA [Streptomyces syringium]
MPIVTASPGRPPGIREDADGLTERQRAVLRCILSSVRSRGYPPSMREIGEAVKLSSTSSVAHQLLALERKGFLHRDPHRPRAYALAPHAQALADARSLPTPPSDAYLSPREEEAERNAAVAHVPLLGRIAAGAPLLAGQETQDVLPMPRQAVGHGELFALTVVGQSMIDAGIRDGDVVTVRRQSAADPGDIVGALLADGEATVKKLRIADDGAWLMPCNIAYQPIRLENDAAILGKVVAVLRSLY